jgi:hypothetical protein
VVSQHLLKFHVTSYASFMVNWKASVFCSSASDTPVISGFAWFAAVLLTIRKVFWSFSALAFFSVFTDGKSVNSVDYNSCIN